MDNEKELRELQRKKSIRMIIMIVCFGIMLFVLLYIGTMAYFTEGQKGGGEIVGGNLDIQLIDNTKDDSGAIVNFPETGIINIMPGVTRDLIVSSANIGETPAWVRIKVEQEIVSKDNTPLPTSINTGTGSVPVLTFNINSDKWQADGNGYYYYNSSVHPAPPTENLFSTVTFAREMGNEYKNCKIYIKVSAQAVQSDYNPIPEGGQVMDIIGWPTD